MHYHLKVTGLQNISTRSNNFCESLKWIRPEDELPDDEVAKRLKAAEVGGRRVTIDYKQYFLRGWNKGGTSYDIVGCQDATSVTSIQ